MMIELSWEQVAYGGAARKAGDAAFFTAPARDG
jgi:hypothetical protein